MPDMSLRSPFLIVIVSYVIYSVHKKRGRKRGSGSAALSQHSVSSSSSHSSKPRSTHRNAKRTASQSSSSHSPSDLNSPNSLQSKQKQFSFDNSTQTSSYLETSDGQTFGRQSMGSSSSSSYSSSSSSSFSLLFFLLSLQYFFVADEETYANDSYDESQFRPQKKPRLDPSLTSSTTMLSSPPSNLNNISQFLNTSASFITPSMSDLDLTAALRSILSPQLVNNALLSTVHPTLDSSSIQVCFLVLCSLGFSLLFLNFFFS
jgi:hypothetical protein